MNEPPFLGAVRWSVVPIVFALGGAVGGATDALFSELVSGRYGEEWEYCAWIGGGIGLGIGTALALLPRSFWAVPLAAPLGMLGYVLSTGLWQFLHDGRIRTASLGDLVDDVFALPLAAVAAPVLTLAHGLYLRHGKDRPLPSALGYAVFGALSGSVFWWGKNLALGLANGAIYGLFQLAAMRAALAIGRRGGRPGPD